MNSLFVEDKIGKISFFLSQQLTFWPSPRVPRFCDLDSWCSPRVWNFWAITKINIFWGLRFQRLWERQVPGHPSVAFCICDISTFPRRAADSEVSSYWNRKLCFCRTLKRSKAMAFRHFQCIFLFWTKAVRLIPAHCWQSMWLFRRQWIFSVSSALSLNQCQCTVECLPVLNFRLHWTCRRVIVHVNHLWIVMLDDLCGQNTVRKVPSHILLGPRKRNLVQPVVQLFELFLCELHLLTHYYM